MTFSSICRRATALGTSISRVAVLVVVLGAFTAYAQAVVRKVTSSTPDATRAELTSRLDSLQRLDSLKGTPAERRDRTSEVAAIRTRLSDGDFHVGDRFLLDAGGADARRDTVVVHDGVTFNLATWPEYSLRGVLRSELQAAVERYVGTYVREPHVHVYPLTRVSVVGGVGRPGFFNVDPDRPLSDVIMVAGGPSQTAQYDRITVFRAGTRIMDEKRVTRALREGQTIDDLGFQSGDQIRVAQKKGRNWGPIIQSTLIAITVLASLLTIIRSSYAQ